MDNIEDEAFGTIAAWKDQVRREAHNAAIAAAEKVADEVYAKGGSGWDIAVAIRALVMQ